MAILKSESYIATNPRFELTEPGSRPKLQKGETTIVYECFETSDRVCPSESWCGTATSLSIGKDLQTQERTSTKSVLYHLDLLAEGTINRVKHAQRRVI